MAATFTDIITLKSPRRQIDQNGFAHVPAVITRVGVQQYREDQLGLGLTGSKLVNVFRPPETVFHEDTIETFKHLPVTNDHPPAGVTPKNAGLVQGGHTGEDVSKLTDKELGVTLHLTDESFINRSKGAQTSAGYDATIVRESGVHDGQAYDYRFDGAMIGNHLALVDAARCGTECRVLDNKHNKETEMEAHEVQKMIDDSIKANNETLTKSIGDTVSTQLKEHQDALDAKAAEAQAKADEEAAKEQAKKDAEEQQKQDRAAIKASVEMRHKLKPLLGDKFDDSKTDKELLVLAFSDRIDDAEGKTEDYLIALLDQEVEARETTGASILDSKNLASAGAVKVSAIK